MRFVVGVVKTDLNVSLARLGSDTVRAIGASLFIAVPERCEDDAMGTSAY
jgi:hypothetical protein